MTYKQKRIQEKLHRLAYELENDASRLRHLGNKGLADDLNSVSSALGDLVRSAEWDK